MSPSGLTCCVFFAQQVCTFEHDIVNGDGGHWHHADQASVGVGRKFRQLASWLVSTNLGKMTYKLSVGQFETFSHDMTTEELAVNIFVLWHCGRRRSKLAVFHPNLAVLQFSVVEVVASIAQTANEFIIQRVEERDKILKPTRF